MSALNQSPTESPAESEAALPWLTLLTLVSAFALSQAFRTVTAMMATGLQQEFGLSSQDLGLFAATFAFAFGLTQFAVGIALDFYGLRRTWLCTFPLAILGALISALAPNFAVLVLGQVLIGMGCSPAFVVCTLFIGRRFPVKRFAAVSGTAMGLGGLGLILTGTPLAWLIHASSWRGGFAVLTGLACISWLLVYRQLHEGLAASQQRPQTLGTALRGFGDIFLLPQTWGILALAGVNYASFLTLRGLWLGPMLMHRHAMTLVQTGNVALLVSLISLFTPALFGHFDPGPARRRHWIVCAVTLMAAVSVAMAFVPSSWVGVGGMVAMAVLSGAGVLQYANVRASYGAEFAGRAMSVFTMSMFLGVAIVQSLSGFAASWSTALGGDPYAGVLVCIAVLLVLGAMVFRLLPAAPVH
ncbi:MAG: MFS transporter [Curvibacter lanceolatus]|uniref:MFS transporter n=1 Tax=Curvibacter lanceolatus TaxID=86182 RepID=UPI0004CE75C9|nr:MFS transporter [Curvibacter lanceolatus]MBV5291536.1 MFS transporter [Curvibacter lanceolatus]